MVITIKIVERERVREKDRGKLFHLKHKKKCCFRKTIRISKSDIEIFFLLKLKSERETALGWLVVYCFIVFQLTAIKFMVLTWSGKINKFSIL